MGAVNNQEATGHGQSVVGVGQSALGVAGAHAAFAASSVHAGQPLCLCALTELTYLNLIAFIVLVAL